jgi:hypothetical protein
MTAEDEAFQKWTGWIDAIHRDITDLVIGRHIFWEVQDIIKANAKIQKPSSFYGWLGMTYAAWGPMGVRRQLDMDTRSISLRRLLTEMARTPQIVSRPRYVTTYATKLLGTSDPSPSIPEPENERQGGAYALGRSEAEDIANKSFDDYAGQGKQHISEDGIKRDLAELQSRSHKVERFATKKVAHLDERPPATLPTFDELDACVDLLEQLVLKYEMILKTSAPQSLLPTWQYDWKAIFREPWISSDGTR